MICKTVQYGGIRCTKQQFPCGGEWHLINFNYQPRMYLRHQPELTLSPSLILCFCVRIEQQAHLLSCDLCNGQFFVRQGLITSTHVMYIAQHFKPWNSRCVDRFDHFSVKTFFVWFFLFIYSSAMFRWFKRMFFVKYQIQLTLLN